MYDPIHTLAIPDGLHRSCDAVASFYLHDKEHAQLKLFEQPDAAFFQNRQGLIEHLKDAVARDHTALRSLNMWLWGHAAVNAVWDNRQLGTLQQDLPTAMTAGGKWSLQILPASLADVGHHMALGQSTNGQNWWLLDPAGAMYVFDTSANLAGFVCLRLGAAHFNPHSRTVLLAIG